MRLITTTQFVRFGKWLWLAVILAASFPTVGFSQATTNTSPLSLAQLRETLSHPAPRELSCRLEGFIRAVNPSRTLVALQDATDVILLSLPEVNPEIMTGDVVAVEINQSQLVQSRFGILSENIPVVDNDGLHSLAEKSGSVFLKAGLNPIRLEWFNHLAEFSLNLDFAGPGIPRQMVPNQILWHNSGGENQHSDFKPGLVCQSYKGLDWEELPDFSGLIPAAVTIATNFSASYRLCDEDCGLSFGGFIQIDHPGRYTFYLGSDDGSRLYVGETMVTCKVVQRAGGAMLPPESLEQALADHRINHWVQVEGEVTFASQNQSTLSLEMLVAGDRVPVTIVDGQQLSAANLLHSWIRVQGVCKFSHDPREKRLVGIFVPGAGQVERCSPGVAARGGGGEALLTTAGQVRQLIAAEAEKQISARIRGVVIYDSPTAVVLHDGSGGVFIGCRAGSWSERPKVGELWEMEGVSDPGLFSPVIIADQAKFLGYAPLPEPITPNRNQLMNGNMDAEYGELHGVITSVSSNEIALLTPEGSVGVVGASDRPLPELPQVVPAGGSLVGSVVRIRGCFATLVDMQTRQVTPGKVFIYPALMEVEDPVPLDPFQAPARIPSDLMWFNAPDLALQRTKLTGQILYALPGEYLVQAGKSGFRVSTPNTNLAIGDLIEAVGFPKLDGPSPVLQQAQIRKTGRAELPKAVPVFPDNLLNRELDAQLIEVKALLMSDILHQGERVLELQTGPQHFVARWEFGAKTFTPFPAGCRLRLTGVYASAYGDQNHAGPHIAPFELWLTSAADIVVLQRPPWWTIQRVVMVLVAVLGILSVMFIWVALLRRKVEQRTVQLEKEIGQRQLVEQHHAIELERTRVARDLHDELGAGLTEVGLLGSLANTPAIAAEARNRYLNQIAQITLSLVASLDEIVWAVNPHYDSVASLVSYFSLHAESLMNLAGIAFRVRVAENIPLHPLDARRRHGVFCVFKEALNNAIRHSGATEVQITFEVRGDKLVVLVVDNGRGFVLVSGTPGKDGLAGMRQRMQELGGTCQITSQPGRGTSIQISLPLNQNQHGQGSNR